MVVRTGRGRASLRTLLALAVVLLAPLPLAAVATAAVPASPQQAPALPVLDAVPLSSSSDFQPLTPARLLETRTGLTTVDGEFDGGPPVGPGQSLDLTVSGRGGVPATGVEAVAVNVTVVNPTVGGYLTLYPTGTTRPLASNLNFTAGQVIPNLVIVKLGASGEISIYNDAGNTDVLVDVMGWFPDTSTFGPLDPARLMDTRPGQLTIDGQAAGTGAVGSGATRDLQVTGRGGVPGSGVGAVVVNVTAVSPTAAGGFLTVFPTGTTRPLASNLNFSAGQVIPNLVIAKIGTGGKISIYNDTGSTQVIVDVLGWFPTDPSYTALTPARIMDSRPGQTTVDSTSDGEGAVGAAATYDLTVTGRGGVPSGGVSAVVLNVTAVSPTASGGFLTVHPAGESLPLASNLNFTAGQVIPNLVIAKVGDGGRVSIYNAAGATHVIVDVMGWFPAADVDPAISVMAAGGQHSCAVLATGSVQCWGDDSAGQLGNGATTTTAQQTPVTVSGISTAVAVTAGDAHTCALLANGTVRCWGEDADGQLGNGATTTAAQASPVTVTGISGAVAIAAGHWHTCAVLGDGTVWCWGQNEEGQLGVGSPGGVYDAPIDAADITTALSLTAGAGHTCALLSDATVECWGDNASGQLGDGGTTDQWAHTPVAGLGGDVAGISAGSAHTCAVLSGGTVQCWGLNTSGQVGNGTTTSPKLSPTDVTSISGAAQVSAGYDHTCVVLSNGGVRCWGNNGSGQIGDGTSTNPRSSQRTVVGFTSSGGSFVAAGGAHTCLRETDATARCWGDDSSGQLGNGATGSTNSPSDVSGLTGIKDPAPA